MSKDSDKLNILMSCTSFKKNSDLMLNLEQILEPLVKMCRDKLVILNVIDPYSQDPEYDNNESKKHIKEVAKKMGIDNIIINPIIHERFLDHIFEKKIDYDMIIFVGCNNYMFVFSLLDENLKLYIQINNLDVDEKKDEEDMMYTFSQYYLSKNFKDFIKPTTKLLFFEPKHGGYSTTLKFNKRFEISNIHLSNILDTFEVKDNLYFVKKESKNIEFLIDKEIEIDEEEKDDIITKTDKILEGLKMFQILYPYFLNISSRSDFVEFYEKNYSVPYFSRCSIGDINFSRDSEILRCASTAILNNFFIFPHKTIDSVLHDIPAGGSLKRKESFSDLSHALSKYDITATRYYMNGWSYPDHTFVTIRTGKYLIIIQSFYYAYTINSKYGIVLLSGDEITEFEKLMSDYERFAQEFKVPMVIEDYTENYLPKLAVLSEKLSKYTGIASDKHCIGMMNFDKNPQVSPPTVSKTTHNYSETEFSENICKKLSIILKFISKNTSFDKEDLFIILQGSTKEIQKYYEIFNAFVDDVDFTSINSNFIRYTGLTSAIEIEKVPESMHNKNIGGAYDYCLSNSDNLYKIKSLETLNINLFFTGINYMFDLFNCGEFMIHKYGDILDLYKGTTWSKEFYKKILFTSKSIRDIYKRNKSIPLEKIVEMIEKKILLKEVPIQNFHIQSIVPLKEKMSYFIKKPLTEETMSLFPSSSTFSPIIPPLKEKGGYIVPKPSDIHFEKKEEKEEKDYCPYFWTCENDCRISDRTGRPSEYSKVYKMCCNEKGVEEQNCKHIIKVINFTYDYTIQDFYREVEYQHKAHELGLSPEVIDFYADDKKGFIVMKKLDLSLHDVLQSMEFDPIKLSNQVIDIIKKLHSNGIVHNDTHKNNFMFDKDGKLYIIDFGKASDLKNIKDGNIDYKKAVDLFDDFDNIPEIYNIYMSNILKNVE